MMSVTRSSESKGHIMAQVTNVKLLDDIDGTKAVETVSFGVDGVGYEIDLNAKNVKASVPSSVGRGAARPKSTGPDAASIRAWANETGVPVSVRGRVSADV